MCRFVTWKEKKTLDETSYFQIMQRLWDQQKISIIKKLTVGRTENQHTLITAGVDSSFFAWTKQIMT